MSLTKRENLKVIGINPEKFAEFQFIFVSTRLSRRSCVREVVKKLIK
jgi:hypothetical protein